VGEKTKIAWTDSTWNPLKGTLGPWTCVKVSEGCANCYAERVTVRFGGQHYREGADTPRVAPEHILKQPLRWRRPRRIFVCSMTDLFAEAHTDAMIDEVMSVVATAAMTNGHTFQILTKRARRMAGYMLRWYERRPWPLCLYDKAADPLPGLWLGISAENQRRYDERVLDLLSTPARVRWVSAEPLLGPLELGPALRLGAQGIGWIVGGGESGGPMERSLVTRQGWPPAVSRWEIKPEALEWAVSLRDQCQLERVPFFWKQWGGPRPETISPALDGKVYHESPVYNIIPAAR